MLLDAGFAQTHAKVDIIININYFLYNTYFNKKKYKIIGRLWAAEATEYMTKVKAQTLGFPALTNTDYHLHMIMGESSLSKQQEPTALFEFTVTPNLETATVKNVNNVTGNSTNNNNDPLCGVAVDNNMFGSNSSSAADGGNNNNDSNSKFCLEFSHSELYGFFTQLEHIQHQLDNLHTSTV